MQMYQLEFLSGGVDSSLITSIASKFDNNIKAYSLGYEEKNFNELSMLI